MPLRSPHILLRDEERPRVSVVLAARDEAATVERAVASIRAQTLEEWELVVVDDGSSDETAELVESFGDPRIRILRERARGLPAALNRGVAAARAALVARQDADDVSLPERLARQARFLDGRADVAVLGTAWREVGLGGTPVKPRTRFVGGRLNDALVHFNPIVHTSAMFRRDAFVALGGYDESLPYAADYDLWLRFELAGATLWNLTEELVVRWMTGENMSSSRERGNVAEELLIRWRDLRRRREAGRDVRRPAARLALRVPMLLVPVHAKRIVRRRRGQAC